MVTYKHFSALDGTDQLDVLGDEGVFLAERFAGGVYSLYYLVHDFYVDIRLEADPGTRITLLCFTRDDPQFNALLEALPVDPARLLRDP